MENQPIVENRAKHILHPEHKVGSCAATLKKLVEGATTSANDTPAVSIILDAPLDKSGFMYPVIIEEANLIEHKDFTGPHALDHIPEIVANRILNDNNNINNLMTDEHINELTDVHNDHAPSHNLLVPESKGKANAAASPNASIPSTRESSGYSLYDWNSRPSGSKNGRMHNHDKLQPTNLFLSPDTVASEHAPHDTHNVNYEHGQYDDHSQMSNRVPTYFDGLNIPLDSEIETTVQLESKNIDNLKTHTIYEGESILDEDNSLLDQVVLEDTYSGSDKNNVRLLDDIFRRRELQSIMQPSDRQLLMNALQAPAVRADQLQPKLSISSKSTKSVNSLDSRISQTVNHHNHDNQLVPTITFRNPSHGGISNRNSLRQPQAIPLKHEFGAQAVNQQPIASGQGATHGFPLMPLAFHTDLCSRKSSLSNTVTLSGSRRNSALSHMGLPEKPQELEQLQAYVNDTVEKDTSRVNSKKSKSKAKALASATTVLPSEEDFSILEDSSDMSKILSYRPTRIVFRDNAYECQVDEDTGGLKLMSAAALHRVCGCKCHFNESKSAITSAVFNPRSLNGCGKCLDSSVCIDTRTDIPDNVEVIETKPQDSKTLGSNTSKETMVLVPSETLGVDKNIEDRHVLHDDFVLFTRTGWPVVVIDNKGYPIKKETLKHLDSKFAQQKALNNAAAKANMNAAWMNILEQPTLQRMSEDVYLTSAQRNMEMGTHEPMNIIARATDNLLVAPVMKVIGGERINRKLANLSSKSGGKWPMILFIFSVAQSVIVTTLEVLSIYHVATFANLSFHDPGPLTFIILYLIIYILSQWFVVYCYWNSWQLKNTMQIAAVAIFNLCLITFAVAQMHQIQGLTHCGRDWVNALEGELLEYPEITVVHSCPKLPSQLDRDVAFFLIDPPEVKSEDVPDSWDVTRAYVEDFYHSDGDDDDSDDDISCTTSRHNMRHKKTKPNSGNSMSLQSVRYGATPSEFDTYDGEFENWAENIDDSDFYTDTDAYFTANEDLDDMSDNDLFRRSVFAGAAGTYNPFSALDSGVGYQIWTPQQTDKKETKKQNTSPDNEDVESKTQQPQVYGMLVDGKVQNTTSEDLAFYRAMIPNARKGLVFIEHTRYVTIASLVCSCVFGLIGAFLSLKTYITYGWAIYQSIGASIVKRKNTQIYLMFILLLKFNIFFTFAIAIQSLMAKFYSGRVASIVTTASLNGGTTVESNFAVSQNASITNTDAAKHREFIFMTVLFFISSIVYYTTGYLGAKRKNMNLLWAFQGFIFLIIIGTSVLLDMVGKSSDKFSSYTMFYITRIWLTSFCLLQMLLAFLAMYTGSRIMLRIARDKNPTQQEDESLTGTEDDDSISHKENEDKVSLDIDPIPQPESMGSLSRKTVNNQYYPDSTSNAGSKNASLPFQSSFATKGNRVTTDNRGIYSPTNHQSEGN